MKKISWKKWNPGLDNDGLTLGEVKNTLPGAAQKDISPIVRLFENPASPLAFKGAITLDRHDAVHILLGRGLLSQDEAFVIGFTMGTSKEISDMDKILFKMVAHDLYPEEYKFNKNDLKVFELALNRGRECRVHKIYDFPFEDYLDTKLGELRDKIGINREKLREVFRKEQKLIPGTEASKRLPI